MTDVPQSSDPPKPRWLRANADYVVAATAAAIFATGVVAYKPDGWGCWLLATPAPFMLAAFIRAVTKSLYKYNEEKYPREDVDVSRDPASS